MKNIVLFSRSRNIASLRYVKLALGISPDELNPRFSTPKLQHRAMFGSPETGSYVDF
jgi:hypothetical protein